MIKDFLISFKDNVKYKTSNPFFGTLILVWIIHNWEFIYSIFNFDSGTSLIDKVAFLKLFLDGKPFLTNLSICLILTFIALIVSYILLNLSRLITNFFEKIVTPWIYKISDKSSIVLKSQYDLLKLNNDDLLIKFEKERESKVKLQAEIERLESKIDKKTLDNLTIDGGGASDQNNLDEDSFLMDRIEDIKKRNWVSKFENLLLDIKSNNYIPSTDMIKYLLKTDIIELGRTSGNTARYTFTTYGNKVKDLFVKHVIINNGSA